MYTSCACLRVVYAVIACMVAVPACAESSGYPQASIEAIWKVQHVQFQYRAADTIYNCSALRQTLERILRALGAHEHMRLKGDCDELGRGRFAIVFASPVEATAENIRSITTYTTEQMLIARTRGVRLPVAEDLQRFQAQWRTVSFARDRTMRLSPGDCELVRQLNRQVLPYLQVRVVNDGLFCSGSSFTNPRLTVAALTAVERTD